MRLLVDDASDSPARVDSPSRETIRIGMGPHARRDDVDQLGLEPVNARERGER